MDTTMNDAPTKAPNVSLAKLFGFFLYIGATCVWRIADLLWKISNSPQGALAIREVEPDRHVLDATGKARPQPLDRPHQLGVITRLTSSRKITSSSRRARWRPGRSARRSQRQGEGSDRERCQT